jgi:hypothetical protein
MKTIIIALILLIAPIVNAQEITKPSFKEACGKAIRASGYQCPRAAIVWNKGLKPRGLEIKVWCGPESGDVYPNLIYRIIMDPDDGHLIYLEPWN